MHKKLEAATHLIHFLALVGNLFSTRTKVVQSDGGGKFISFSLKTYLETHGVLHCLSCPGTPQQNGLDIL